MKFRIIIFLVFIIGIFQASASHAYGGDMFYEYVGTTTGIPNQYRISITLYLPLTGIVSPQQMPVWVCSNCFATDSISLPLDSGFIPLVDPNNCITPGTAGSVQLYAYHYSTLYILPGNCANFSFNSYPFSQRPAALANIQNSGFQFFRLHASLNSLLGVNSSPKFITYPRINFCVNQSAIWASPITEVDGDSIYFKLSTPLAGTQHCTPSQVVYSNGYSALQPITTSPPGGTSLIGNTPFLQFTPSSAELVVVRLEIEEFRTDTVYPMFYLISSITRDVVIAVTANCNPVMGGVYYDYNDSTIYADPATGLPSIAQHCLDSIIRVPFSSLVNCFSIAPDGSDFRLAAPNGQPVPIKSAVGLCNNLSETTEIKLSLYNAYHANGLHVLYSKQGNDGNTVVSTCGYSMFEYDTLQINVSGCSGVGVNEQTMAPTPLIPSTLRLGNTFSVTIPESVVGDYQLSFYNMQGALLFTETFRGSGNWPLQNISALNTPGLYVCRLQNANMPGHQWQQKVLVLP